MKKLSSINITHDIEKNLTDFAKDALKDRYLLREETINELFERVADAYCDDEAHKNRLLGYLEKLWFMPSTPILSNGGASRGLPISCFLNESDDSLEGIIDLWNENIWLASRGGGIGSYWGNLRSIGEKLKSGGTTSGIVPFIVVQNSLTMAISQGSLRRGNAAVYLPIWHPEIDEFLDIRRPSGGDPNRKALNMNNAVVIDDKFMQAVEKNEKWDLLSPKTGEVIETVSARNLWIKILTTRMETGEPYILYIDNVTRLLPEVYKKNNLSVKTSNLCSEITLATGPDQFGKERTAVCCLSSVNLEHFEEWSQDENFITDIMAFLDNVLEDFIQKAPEKFYRAKYSAMRERSVGLGAMGFHSFLQKKNVPMESAVAKSWNKKIFEHLKNKSDAASQILAQKKGPCPDAADVGLQERFSHKMAIAPTASISIIAGSCSPGIEPNAANVYNHKTLSGTHVIKNKYLKQLLSQKGYDDDKTWSSIATNCGSVQHLKFLSQWEKDVFKTAYEINQNHLLELAAQRTPWICQAQSLNLFLPANIHKKHLHELHFKAWKLGIKSLYYCRSLSIQRVDVVADNLESNHNDITAIYNVSSSGADECSSCQ